MADYVLPQRFDQEEIVQDQQATRARGEALMRGFTPRMGWDYTKCRNVDRGPGGHRDVSGLSPYIRRRLVLERDVVAAALGAHGPEACEKFVQEIIWRGYFKGWLERRPSVWASYRIGLQRDLAKLDTDRRLRRAVDRAEAGETGLACFDAWAQELVATGYLHNHARMWFASIWIFTLRLPWRVGADVFYRHLLDGDPASNTLGWRWVAGLHSRGKPYRAQAWNIAQFTGGRFGPRDADLAADVQGLEAEEPYGLPPVAPLRVPLAPDPGAPAALLITEEDCRVEDFAPQVLDIRAVAVLSASHLRSPRAVSGAVAAFEAAALADAAARVPARVPARGPARLSPSSPASPLASAPARVPACAGVSAFPVVQVMQAGVPDDLAAWAARAGARQIVTAYVPEGPLRDWLRRADPALRAQGISLCEWRRDWDGAIWPHATAGFFKVKARIPRILNEAGLT